jgi:hypothetical protein
VGAFTLSSIVVEAERRFQRFAAVICDLPPAVSTPKRLRYFAGGSEQARDQSLKTPDDANSAASETAPRTRSSGDCSTRAQSCLAAADVDPGQLIVQRPGVSTLPPDLLFATVGGI